MKTSKSTIELPLEQVLPGGMVITCDKRDQSHTQYLFFKQPNKKSDTQYTSLPLNKVLKGSIIIRRTPDNKNQYEQFVRIYRKKKSVSSKSIYDSRYSRVNVSRSRVTVTMSFPICDDGQRLKARMQNFANIVIEESDEIAAMLNQQGADKVQDAWQFIMNSQDIEEGEQ